MTQPRLISHTVELVHVDPDDEVTLRRLLGGIARDFNVTVELLDELASSGRRQVRLHSRDADKLVSAVAAVADRTMTT